MVRLIHCFNLCLFTFIPLVFVCLSVQVRHLERVLQSIAHRVVTTNLNELALRHTYSVHVRRRTKHTKLAEALVTVAGGLAATTVERLSQLHTTTAAWGYNSRQIVCQQLFDEGAGKLSLSGKHISLHMRHMSKPS